jgi:hypothetical protein
MAEVLARFTTRLPGPDGRQDTLRRAGAGWRRVVSGKAGSRSDPIARAPDEK